MRYLLTMTLLASFAFFALAQQERSTYPVTIQEKLFDNPDMHISNVYQPITSFGRTQSDQFMTQLSALGVSPDLSAVDLRSGKWGTLITTMPLIPGSGLGNTLTWQSNQKRVLQDRELYRAEVRNAFFTYLYEHADTLKLDPMEFGEPTITVEEQGDMVFIYVPRLVNGVPVRKSFIGATVRFGNLVKFGIHHWGDIAEPIAAHVPMLDALELMKMHLGADLWQVKHLRQAPTLAYLPFAAGKLMEDVTLGQGYQYRLVWELTPELNGDYAEYVGLVDANTGEIVAFQDETQYFHSGKGASQAPASLSGGVYPVSNDGEGDDGIEQDYKMPFAHLLIDGKTFTTNSGGDALLCFEGEISTQLDGAYVTLTDNCGQMMESATTAPLDLGFGENPSDTDCQVAPGASAGNTKSSRSAFYEINKIAEIARSYLTDNEWLRQPLSVTVNINDVCNATASSAGLRFFQSGGGCANTGEIAGVFDHEWGHGLDIADGTPGVQSPSEGIADIYASWRLNTSCIGRNFTQNNCGGFGDPCLDCTGVREIDFAKRASGTAHDITWAQAACGSGGPAPCGGGVHCEGQVYAESFYDLWKRDLPNRYGMDDKTAQELVGRLVLLGNNGVGSAFQCNQGSGGCNNDSAYLNFLVADDDNGSLEDGTPHMQAIFDAFDRHGIACADPIVNDSGCANTPTTAPVVSATVTDRSALLSWTAVANAQSYNVYRGEGILSCSGGKILLANTTSTQYLDNLIANDMDYTYIVIPVGASASCYGPASDCFNLSEGTAAGNLFLSQTSDLVMQDGDSDPFYDNCERATLMFAAFNLGAAAQAGGQIVSITSDHESLEIMTDLPIDLPSLEANCGDSTVLVDFMANELAAFDSITFQVTYSAPNFTEDRVATYTIDGIQTNLELQDTLTFDFEEGLEEWTTVSGVFQRTTGTGGNGSSAFLTSSTALNDACHEIVSPVMLLSGNSTLSIWTNYDIEPFSSNTWWDRANVGIELVETEARTAVSPSGGRAYDASGNEATLCIQGEPGFAGSNQTWAESTFTSQDLDTATFGDRQMRLSVIYSTDSVATGDGFSIDEITFTNVFLQVPDLATATCSLGCVTLEENRANWPNTNVLELIRCLNEELANQPLAGKASATSKVVSASQPQ